MRSWFLGTLTVLSFSSTAMSQDMPLTQVLIPEEGWELLSEGHKFTEGPAVDSSGNVFFTDVPENKIFKIDLKGKVSLFAKDTARTNGLMFGADGLMYGCRNGDEEIVAYKPDGSFNVVAEGVKSNDIVVTSKGAIYFTDPAGGKVWYVSPQGKKRVVAENLKPNGLILWSGEGTLVVTDRDDPHLWTFRVEADGGLAFKEKYYLPLTLPSGKDRPGSDGMSVDADGRLYVATYAGIQMFDPTGRMGGVILKPQEKFLSNLVFGGPDLNFMYVTCTDKVYRRRVKPRGIPYFLNAKK